jgi:cell division protein FtsN
MYCENCQLEIKEQEEKRCPLCGGPLSESSAAGTMPDHAGGIDFESLMQDDAAAFVLDDDDESGGAAPEGQAAPESYSPVSNVVSPAPGPADFAQTSGAIAFSDDSSADMLDQVLQEYDPLVDEHFKVKKTGSKSTTALLLIVLLVLALGGGAYYYFMLREQEAPAPVVPVQIAKPQKKDAVLDKVLRKEPLPAQSAHQQAADNATQAAKKPDEAKPAQTVEKKTEALIVGEQQPAEVKPVEPIAPSKTPEKAARQEKHQPEAAMEKTEPAPSAPQVAVAPALPSVPAQRPAPAGGTPAAEEAKKSTEPPAAPVAKPPAAAAGKPAFSVLTGSFRSQSNAEAEVSRLRKLGFDARTAKVDLKGKGQWHRVLIGSWTRRAEALQAVADVRLKTGKKDASVIAAE